MISPIIDTIGLASADRVSEIRSIMHLLMERRVRETIANVPRVIRYRLLIEAITSLTGEFTSLHMICRLKYFRASRDFQHSMIRCHELVIFLGI